MPKRIVIDHARLGRILVSQHQVITRSQALGCGIPQSTVSAWCKSGGKWQKMLPGVYLAVTGTPTLEQRLMAAVLYAGPRSVITGSAAVKARRLRTPATDMVDVLIPASVKRQSLGYVRIHRTRRMPVPHRAGAIRFAPAARAVADASHWLSNLGDVRALIAEAVQKQVCSIAEIGIELSEGANRDSAHLRKALTAVRSGIRSEAEADFRDRVLRSDLMAPQYNVFLRARDGTDIGEADAWWAEAGVSAEIDSQEYHFYRDGWLKTDAKHGRMLKYGIRPHHFAPSRVKNDWPAIYEELKASIADGRRRPRLDIVAFDPLG
jgi:hypothetical protein